jgi:DNA polymerase alpha subunit B
VGRIVLDAEPSGPGVKLNEHSLILEASRAHGDGLRVRLQLAPGLKIRGGYKGLGGVGLFPGAVVALKGRNGGGGYFIASEILAVCVLKLLFVAEIEGLLCIDAPDACIPCTA